MIVKGINIIPFMLRSARTSRHDRRRIMASHNVSSHTKTLTGAWPKIVLFGDSITQYNFSPEGCWGSLLADYLQRTCDVVNRGFSGYNTRWCVRMLPKVFKEFSVNDLAMVTIFLGANDSNLSSNTRQHVPLEEYREHLLTMVETLQTTGVAKEKIVLISPPACDVEAWAADCLANDRECHKCNSAAGEYAKACVQAANEAGTGCVDLYTEMMMKKNWQKMLNDGLHLSPQGSEFLFELLKPFVSKATSGLETQYPLWDTIDNDNPDASLS